jgi:hypothetical protein
LEARTIYIFARSKVENDLPLRERPAAKDPVLQGAAGGLGAGGGGGACAGSSGAVGVVARKAVLCEP